MARPPRAVRARALAKINLHLEILDRRPDGYHDLRTIFQSIALHDTVTIEPWDGPFTIVCDDPSVPTDATNLVWRAAEAGARAWGRGPLTGLRVTLEKRVPAQSGLGGGSADAMATLRALAHLWRVEATPAALAAIGTPIGADVAFFAMGGTVDGAGRGDVLTRRPDVPDHHLVVLRPAFGVGTADAYRWVAESRASRGPAHARGPGASVPGELADYWNDFEPEVAARHPLIADLVGELRAAGATLALLSGSGSAVVGLFPERAAADAALSDLSARHVAPESGPESGAALQSALVSETVSAAAYARAVAPAEFS